MKKFTSSGFSLIELIVSAMVIALSIVATVSMVRKAQDLTTIDKHRRAARGAILKELETVTYQQANFSNIALGTTIKDSILIDSMVPTRKLFGKMKIVIDSLATFGVAAPYKRVRDTVKWREWGVTGTASADSEQVSIEKWISP